MQPTPSPAIAALAAKSLRIAQRAQRRLYSRNGGQYTIRGDHATCCQRAAAQRRTAARLWNPWDALPRRREARYWLADARALRATFAPLPA